MQNEAWRVWVVEAAAVRHLQGRREPRRPRGRARAALGLRRGEPRGSSTSCARPRTRSRSAWAPCAPTRRGSTRATCPCRADSRGGSRSAAGPLPEGSELELRSGPLEDELRALAAEGVQSLLLEGGPTLAGAFLEAGLVDKVLVFVAPVLAGGDGPHAAAAARIRARPLPPERPAGRRGRPARSLRPRALIRGRCPRTPNSSAPTTRSSACSRSG